MATKRLMYGVPRAKKLGRDAYRAKIKAFTALAKKETNPERRRLILKQKAWYKHYLLKNFPKG